MNALISTLLEMEEYKQLLGAVKDNVFPVTVTGPSESQKSHIAFSIKEHSGRNIMIITYNELQAKKIIEDFSYLAGDKVVFFPAKELILYDVEAKSNELVYQRLSALYRIISGEGTVVVTSIEALLHRLVAPEEFINHIIKLTEGQRIDLRELVGKLTAGGYERVDVVEGKGQFSVRGGIIDFYPVNLDYGVRLELFDDEIDSIRQFDTVTQRSYQKLESTVIVPAREVILHDDRREQVIEKIRKELDGLQGGKKKKFPGDALNHLSHRVNEDIERFRHIGHFAGMDRYIPVLLNNASTLFDYISDSCITFLDEPSRIRQRAENLLLEYEETAKGLLEKGYLLPSCMQIAMEYGQFAGKALEQNIISMNALSSANPDFKARRTYSLVSRQLHSYQGQLDLLIEDIRLWKARKGKIIILSGTKGRGERLVETLRGKDIESSYSDSPPDKLLPGQILITHGSLAKGFEYPLINFVIVSDKEIFGQDKKAKKVKGRKDVTRLKAFTDLNAGDYVVHQSHGIGLYVGIQKLVVDGITKDYLKIQYQEGDFLYIPTNQLDSIQKYIGSEGRAPRMNKLGGSDWQRTKSRVKESLKELAGELIKLYAERQSNKGYSFSKDTVWQVQFEETFPYEETTDQLRCIDEVKRDMESERPMDRLLCGDVGYGKTEVAIRAAFKAVMSGKQVAYLVPTTILAQQQYNNFVQRVKDFPVRVDMISRFRSPGEQKKIIGQVKSGEVDILIGTHRLIQKDIQFKDLGLLIVDEEQRFGVTHKEKLKNIKKNVDVLTLTATPIPRTLHMSLTGIRDMSVIEEPPEERYPVQTYVMEHNPDIIRDAIIRELHRSGQVYYLYNRVRSIHRTAGMIQQLVPEAKVAVAHGQMNEEELEEVMYNFLNGEYDVLVCTTIIESGLDIPNVNTIIVEDADRLGLAQLYQIRGRVGRSNRLAYAYITYRRDKVLPEPAEKRLQAIKEFTEFGSGFKIAMRDLEIRGAGNLLGPEQHGHMEAVGYDMYCRLLDEAVRELSGGTAAEEEIDTSIELNISAYIPDEYIGNEKQKIEIYKKIAAISDEDDRQDTIDEVIDRYGDLPAVVENLIEIAYIRAIAQKCGITGITEKGSLIVFQFRNEKSISLEILGQIMGRYPRQLLFTASNNPYLSYRFGEKKNEYLGNIKILLQDIKSLKFGQ